MSLENDPIAKARIMEDGEQLMEVLSSNMPVTSDEFELYHFVKDNGATERHGYRDSRSKQDVAVKLGTTASQIGKLLHGKEILDIGCGTGQFAADISKDKSISVTALDNDANMLDRIPNRQNITPVMGNGYDLTSSGISESKFDAIFVTYSTNYWASSIDEVALSLTEPLKALRPGGSLFYTPAAQNWGLTDANLRGLMPPAARQTEYGPKPGYDKVHGLFALATWNTLRAWENTELVNIAYRASLKNRTFKPIPLPNGRMVSPDSYSVVITPKF